MAAIDRDGWLARRSCCGCRCGISQASRNKDARGSARVRDLGHYSVELCRTPKEQIPLRYLTEQCVRVTFAPELSARDKREATVGGRTDYGIEVSYDILRSNLKIIKTSFGR